MTSSGDREPSAVDGGFGWVVLAASFINQVILLGYVKAAGVLFVEWQEYFNVGSKEVGWVGIVLAFFGPTSGLIAGGLTPRFGSRPVSVVGGLIVAASLAATSFSKQLWNVYVLSIVTAVGLGFSFQPSITVVGFYFKKRIGIANGVAFSGVGAGIVVMPPLLQFLSTKFQWQGAVLIFASIMLLTILLSLTFRPTDREKYFMLVSAAESRRDDSDSSKSFGQSALEALVRFCNYLGIDLLWRFPRFGILALSYALAGYGYYASVVFFSSRAVYDAGIPKQDASFLVSAIGVGSTVGRAGHGFLIHIKVIGITQLYVVSGFAAAISSFLNPWSNTFMSLLACALTFGLFSGSMLAVSLMCARQFLPTASISRSFGVLILSNGIGIVFGTFTMGFLNDISGNYVLSFIAAGIGFTLAALLLLVDGLYRVCRKNDDVTVAEDDDIDAKEGDCDEEPQELKDSPRNGKIPDEDGMESVTVFGEERKAMVQEPETSV